MHALSSFDYTIIVGYLGLSLIAGLLMTRKASASLDDYFLGGRSLPWWLLGMAGMANWFDLTGTMIITSFLYMLGPRGLYVEFRGGAVLVLAFMLAYTGKWHRRSGCMTAAEWMTYRFGEGRASESVRLLTAALGIANTVMLLAYLIRGASLFLGMFFPYPPMATTLVLLVVTTLYTLGAGFYGVVLTDLVQGVIVLVSCVVVSLMAWRLVPDTTSLADTAWAVTGNLHWTDARMSVHTTMPAGYKAYQSLMMVAMFYLSRNILFGLGTGNEPRYFGARNDRECGLQSFLQGIMVSFRWPLMIGFAVMGIYLVKANYPDPAAVQRAAALVHQFFPQTTEAYWHDLTSNMVNAPGKYPAALIEGLNGALGSHWQDRLPLVGFHGTINPEQILPAVLLNSIPAGLKGMIVVAMFAAMMSCKNGLREPGERLLRQGHLPELPAACGKNARADPGLLRLDADGGRGRVSLRHGGQQHQRYLGLDHHELHCREPRAGTAAALLVALHGVGRFRRPAARGGWCDHPTPRGSADAGVGAVPHHDDALLWQERSAVRS